MNLNTLFSSMINISMFVDFAIITYENHMFKINLSRLIKIQIHIWNLQSRLQVDEILNVFHCQVNDILKCDCGIPTFTYCTINMSNI
jgi:hypothetical protein